MQHSEIIAARFYHKLGVGNETTRKEENLRLRTSVSAYPSLHTAHPSSHIHPSTSVLAHPSFHICPRTVVLIDPSRISSCICPHTSPIAYASLYNRPCTSVSAYPSLHILPRTTVLAHPSLHLRLRISILAHSFSLIPPCTSLLAHPSPPQLHFSILLLTHAFSLSRSPFLIHSSLHSIPIQPFIRSFSFIQSFFFL